VSNLHEAAGSGDAAETERLVAAGADVEEQREFGARPLHVASWMVHVGVMRVLVELGANVEAQMDGGLRPLHQAVLKGET
jgi:ankyrin repeat protein